MTSAQLDALYRLIRPKSSDHKPDPQRAFGILCGMAFAVHSTPEQRAKIEKSLELCLRQCRLSTRWQRAEHNSHAIQTLEGLGILSSAKSVEKVTEGVIRGLKLRADGDAPQARKRGAGQ